LPGFFEKQHALRNARRRLQAPASPVTRANKPRAALLFPRMRPELVCFKTIIMAFSDASDIRPI
jgi:hypothetical protein